MLILHRKFKYTPKLFHTYIIKNNNSLLKLNKKNFYK